jgi:hypothetical protein
MRISGLIRLAAVIVLALVGMQAANANADTEARLGTCGSQVLDTFSNPDGSMFVLGNAWMCGDVYLDVFFKLKADGTADESWSDGGFKALPENVAAWSTAVRGGRLAYAFGGKVFRFAPEGLPDSTFGDDGEVSLQIPFGSRTINDIAVDSQGRTLLVAAAGSPQKLTVARLGADGELDDTFGEDGVANPMVPEDAFGQQGFRIATDGEDRVVVAGGHDGFVIRLGADGTPDSSFGPANDGISHADVPLLTVHLAEVYTGPDDGIQMSIYGVNRGGIGSSYCDYGYGMSAVDSEGSPLPSPISEFSCSSTASYPVTRNGILRTAIAGSNAYRGEGPNFYAAIGTEAQGWARRVSIGPAGGRADAIEYQAATDRLIVSGMAFGGDCSFGHCPGNRRMAIVAFDAGTGEPAEDFGKGGVAYFPRTKCRFGSVGVALIPAWKKCRVTPPSIQGFARIGGRANPSLTVNARFTTLPEQPGGMGQRLNIGLPKQLRLKRPLTPGRIAVRDPAVDVTIKNRRVILTYWPEPAEWPEIQAGQENEAFAFKLRFKRGTFKPLPRRVATWKMKVPVRVVGLPGIPGNPTFDSNQANWYAPNHTSTVLRVTQ